MKTMVLGMLGGALAALAVLHYTSGPHPPAGTPAGYVCARLRFQPQAGPQWVPPEYLDGSSLAFVPCR
jgi:hypothetical protein